ncbi:hypothetical protein ACTFIZ_002156 [Dictyostelium cf. discoideum]
MYFNKYQFFIIFIFLIINCKLILKANGNKDIVINLNNDYYNSSNELYDFKKPIGYIKINSKSQLVDSLLFFKNMGKRISIRSGGHSSCSFSLINDTINFDLSGLKTIKVDTSLKFASIQSGVLLGEYYKEIVKHGLGSTGGMCGGVGIGGIALGGGSNFISPKYGYMTDNIIEFKILLSSGEIINSNPFNQYKDLYWALSGSGQGSFGIVIEYKIKLHNILPVYYTNEMEIPLNIVAQTILVIDKFINSNGNLNKRMSFDVKSFVSTKSNLKNILSFYFIDGTVEEGEIEFKKLLNLLPWGKINNNFKTKKTFLEIVQLAPMDNNQHIREITKSRFIMNLNFTSASTFQEFIYFSNNLLKNINNDSVSFFNQFYYHGGNHLLENKKSSFIHKNDESKYSVVFNCQYEKEESDNYFKFYKNYLHKILPIFGDKIYQNYPDDEFQNWQSSYYGKNYKKLQEIKKKYDPNNYFKNQQSIELPYSQQ